MAIFLEIKLNIYSSDNLPAEISLQFRNFYSSCISHYMNLRLLGIILGTQNYPVVLSSILHTIVVTASSLTNGLGSSQSNEFKLRKNYLSTQFNKKN